MMGCYERILLLGQITIEEELELSNDSTIHPRHQKASMMTTASSEPIRFEVEQTGPMKIVFEKGRRFKESLQKTKIDISITDPDGKIKYKRKISPAGFFSEPVQGRLTPECTNM